MSSETRLLDAFDDCLTRLKAGDSITACLRRYPDLEQELWPMLNAAQATLRASLVPIQSEQRSRQRLLSAAAEASHKRVPVWGGFGRLLATGVSLALALTLGTTGLYLASASTVPGDRLYTVKRTFEDLQLGLTRDPAARLRLEDQFNQRRDDEIQEEQASGRTAPVSFSGVLSSHTGSQWQVGRYQVRVTGTTEISGQIQDGLMVHVSAELAADGSLTATQIEIEEQELEGTLAASGSGWSLQNVSFSLVPQTVVNGIPLAGAEASARVRHLQSGDVVAISLSVAGSEARPSETPEPTEGLPATRSPKETESGDGGQIVKTAEPSETPQPSETSAPEATEPPQSTESQQGGNGSGQDSTPQPSATKSEHEGGWTPQPGHTPEPTEQHTPEHSGSPTPQQGGTSWPEHSGTGTPDH